MKTHPRQRRERLKELLEALGSPDEEEISPTERWKHLQLV